MTPMAPIKSSTVRALSEVVVTFLNVSPAVFCLAAAPAAGGATCAEAWPANPAAIMATAASAAPDTFNLIRIVIIILSRSGLSRFLISRCLWRRPGLLLGAAVVGRPGKQLAA